MTRLPLTAKVWLPPAKVLLVVTVLPIKLVLAPKVNAPV